jgi:hypothetical protein
LFGFVSAWIIRSVSYFKLKKNQKSTEGLLESEKLIKETLRKESALAFKMKESVEAELGRKLEQSNALIKVMDEDIILLQKSNEETEELLKITQPEIHALKLKLIEANNTISRLKSQLTEKNS